MRAMEAASPRRPPPSKGAITVRGARQNNLKGLDVDLPLRELIVVTGVSGSGKSSLAFDTVYAEGQRRYVETFSPYARQFLDRMDRPRADRVDGIPPAVAVDQTNQVRTSRSTVGTMTEINDYLKLLFARHGRLHCRGCGEVVRRDTPESIADRLLGEAAGERAVVRFRVRVPDEFPEEEVRRHLARQGYTRVTKAPGGRPDASGDASEDASGGPAVATVAAETAEAAEAAETEIPPAPDAPRQAEAAAEPETERAPGTDPAPPSGASVGSSAGARREAGGDAGPGDETVPEPRSESGAEESPEPPELVVVQDRLRLGSDGRTRLVEALEAALSAGRGRAEAAVGTGPGTVLRFSAALQCPRCDIAYRDPTPGLFSFNSPIGACDACRGFGREMGIDYDLVIPDERLTLREGAIKPLQTKTYLPYQRYLLKQAERAGIPDDVPWHALSREARAWVIEGDGRRRDGHWFGVRGFFDWLERKSYRMHIRVLLSRYRGYLPCTGCGGARLKPEALDWRVTGGDGAPAPYPGSGPDAPRRPVDRGEAGGAAAHRGEATALDLHEVCTLPLDRCLAFFEDFRPSAPLDEPASLLLEELRSRLRYLVAVGLGYLTLDRQSRTLSGGEVQRINLTTALGTSLVNTLFVLDEPSVGLHPRDLGRMIGVLHRLRDAGNTILVVEHDEQVIRAADRVLDLGPGPGAAGGEVVYQGPPQGLARCADSLTGAYLGGRRRVAAGPTLEATESTRLLGDPSRQGAPAAHGRRFAPDGDGEADTGLGCPPAREPGSREGNRAARPAGSGASTAPAPAPAKATGSGPGPDPGQLLIYRAAEHNLKGIDVRIPLGGLVCVTGVSGSGKSTLIEEVCYRGLLKRLGRPRETPGRHDGIDGAEAIADVVLVDQSPIGKTSRSVPASYVGALDPIRKLFAAEPLARERGYPAGRFSFNHVDGRCPTCAGNGFEHLEMQFLSDVYLRCPDCDGRRFRADVLEVKIAPDGLSIAGVLDLTVGQAIARFADSPEVVKRLRPLAAVGLGYVTLGQPVPSLSGGEAQRLKLAGHLAAGPRRGGAARRNEGAEQPGGGTLFLFDEPTTGLHFEDVAILLAAFRELIAAGHSVAVIEHHLDVIAAADWIIDLGPEGGEGGGEVVCEGPPAAVAAEPRSYTGRELHAHLARRSRQGEAGERTGEGGRLGSAPCTGGDGDSDGPSDPSGFPHRGRRRAERGDPVPIPGHGARPTRGIGEAPAPNAPAGAVGVREAPAPYAPPEVIEIRRARDHNLKDIDVRLPRDRFTAITGVSGSGKSTLAFDIVFAEGQRRYLESLNAYARQFVQPAARPDVDAVLGIPPTVAIEQRTSRGGAKSTVATATEIHHFLRLLFSKLGIQHCPDCNRPIESRTRDAVVASVMKEFRGRPVELLAPLVVARKGYYTDLARWAARKGYSHLRVDGKHLPTGDWPRLDRYREHDIDLPVAVLTVDPAGERALRTALDTALELGRSLVIVAERGGPDARPDTGEGAKGERRERRYSTARACAECGRSFDEPDPRLFSFNSRHGWCPRCRGVGLEPAASAPASAPATAPADGRTRRRRRKGTRDRPPSEPRTVAEYEREELPEGALAGSAVPCRACAGERLRPEARAVRFRGRTIGEIGRLSIAEARAWVEDLALDGRDEAVAGDLLAELRSRLDFLLQVGLGYLSLHRAAPSLSGGEAQRIRLAAQLGSNLRGVCYVLDEPTIGLHARDNSLLLDALDRLRAHGNTVLVVEHDEATIRRAEHVIDLGPGAGAGGGEVVAAGSLGSVMRERRSVTGRWLSRPPPPMRSESPVRLAGGDGGQAWLEVRNARRHNLKGISPRFPLGRLVCVTGVSGSGKSTLVREVLREGLESALRGAGTGAGAGAGAGTGSGGGSNGSGGGGGSRPGGDGGDGRAGGGPGCDGVVGFEPVTRVLEVDQTPIGKTPRSCPITYLKIWDHVRRLFAETTEARIRGWSASRFSFNTGEGAGGGRCPACGGQGERKIEMSFLPDARVPCDECEGTRFTRETLGVRFRGKSIGDILHMTVEEAVEFFPAHPRVHHALLMLREVGLGYLRLGQQSPSLSGGEAQRLKLVTELAKARPSDTPRARRNHTAYLLDEPTVGLHMADVEKLVRVLHRLAAAGHTVIVIEHNLDVIAAADWIVDLGPEGGDAGGRIVAEGTPDQIAGIAPVGHTGRVLAEFLRAREAA